MLFSSRLLFTRTLNMSAPEWCVHAFSLGPFMDPLQVLDVAHLHNNAAHLSPSQQ